MSKYQKIHFWKGQENLLAGRPVLLIFLKIFTEMYVIFPCRQSCNKSPFREGEIFTHLIFSSWISKYFRPILTESYLFHGTHKFQLTYACVSLKYLSSHFNQTEWERVFTWCHVFARVRLILLIPPSYFCHMPGSVRNSRHNFKMMQ